MKEQSKKIIKISMMILSFFSPSLIDQAFSQEKGEIRISLKTGALSKQQKIIYNLNKLPVHVALYRLKQAIDSHLLVEWDGSLLEPDLGTLELVCSRLCTPQTCQMENYLVPNQVSSSTDAKQYITGVACMTFCYSFPQAIEGCRKSAEAVIGEAMAITQQLIDDPSSSFSAEEREKVQTFLDGKSRGYHQQIYNQFVKQMIEGDAQNPVYQGCLPPPPPLPVSADDPSLRERKEEETERNEE